MARILTNEEIALIERVADKEGWSPNDEVRNLFATVRHERACRIVSQASSQHKRERIVALQAEITRLRTPMECGHVGANRGDDGACVVCVENDRLQERMRALEAVVEGVHAASEGHPWTCVLCEAANMEPHRDDCPMRPFDHYNHRVMD